MLQIFQAILSIYVNLFLIVVVNRLKVTFTMKRIMFSRSHTEMQRKLSSTIEIKASIVSIITNGNSFRALAYIKRVRGRGVGAGKQSVLLQARL